MPPRIPQRVPSVASIPSIHTHCSSCLRREFSSTPSPQTRLRRQMFAWLEGPGENFRHPLPGSTNYLSAYGKNGRLIRNEAINPTPNEETADSQALSDAAEGEAIESATRDDLRPFPLNRNFISETVLSVPLRNEIWRRVQVDGKSVRTVSVELGVEMRRVGAVVRLEEIERQMRAAGKPLALPYARAVHQMLPTTPYEDGNITPHEPINDLPVHHLSTRQIFYPTSESRAFNRTDAGRVFSAAPRLPDEQDVGQGGMPALDPWQDIEEEKVGKQAEEISVLKPADARIPHPHLIALEKDKRDPALRGNEEELRKRYAQRLIEDARDREIARIERMARKEAKKVRINSGRWQVVFTDFKATSEAGKNERSPKRPGHRYGVPHEDRKKGQVKIPTKVEV